MQGHPLTPKRILIACGGTGGHFYPGYALAEALRERGWETLFLLRREDPAAACLKREDLPFVETDLRGMPRRAPWQWPGFLLRVSSSLRFIRNVLIDWRPCRVAGMGGYLTFPAVLAAWRCAVPSLIHESNALLGLANRACLPFVSKALLGLPLAAIPRWPAKVRYQLTGTPIRKSLWRFPEKSAARRELGLEPDKPTLLVFGGSQGARAINRLAPQALAELAGKRPEGLQCLHLSGRHDESEVRAAYAGLPLRSVVRTYQEEMGLAYAAADLALCRAGASTLAEIVAARKPAVFIPYPYSASKHQNANAEALVRIGAARSLPEAGLVPGKLAAILEDLICSESSQATLEAMSGGYARLALPTPAETLDAMVEAVEGLA